MHSSSDRGHCAAEVGRTAICLQSTVTVGVISPSRFQRPPMSHDRAAIQQLKDAYNATRSHAGPGVPGL
eukprot:5761283-Prymnesium_polylepis.2